MKMRVVYKKLASRVSVQLTSVEIESGDYSPYDVERLQDDRDSWMAAFLKFSDNHDRLVEENEKLREIIWEIVDDCEEECYNGLSGVVNSKTIEKINQLKDQNNDK